MEKSNYRLPLFCVVTLLFWASTYTYVPLLTSYVVSLGASNQFAGLIVGSYGFVQMLLRIPVGIMSDKFHKRKLFISIGLSFSFFSAIGLFLFKDLTLILIFRGLAGVAAATWVDFTILYSSYHKKNETAKAIGTISFYNTIGQTVAMFFGPYAADLFGIESPFIIGAALAILGLALSFFIIEKFEENPQPMTVKAFFHVGTNKTLIAVSSLAILSQIVTFSTVNGFTPQFAQEMLNITKSQMGLLTVFSSLPTAIASLFAGRLLAAKYGEKKIIIIGFVMTGIFTIIIPFTGSIFVLILTQIIAGFGRGLSFPMLMGLSIKDVGTSQRATAMGFFQSIYGLGMFVGPVVMGIIGDIAGLKSGFFAIGAIALLTALISYFVIQTKKESAQ